MSNKTVTISPNLLRFNSKSKKTKFKIPKKIINENQNKNANTIKKELLKRVKKFQQIQETDETKTNINNLNIYNYSEDQNTKETSFDAEFKKSLGFLQNIYNKNKNKNKKPQNTTPVNISLSEELKNAPNKTPKYSCLKTSNNFTQKIGKNVQINTDNNLFFHNNNSNDFIDINTNCIPVISKPIPEQPIQEQPIPEQPIPEQPFQKQPIPEQPIHKELIHKEPAKIDKIDKMETNELETVRDEIKKQFKTLENLDLLKNQNKLISKNEDKTPKLTRITRNYTYKLGKQNGKIGILIKNRDKIKNINQITTELKQKSIADIKDYLRQHNLIKLGTQAPNDVLRKIYESSILSGDINNTGENFIYNYLHNE